MKESVLVRRILRELHACGAKAIKIHGSPFTEAGTPDIIGCYKGRAFALEAKTGKARVSPVQARRSLEWITAGAVYSTVWEDFDVKRFLLRMKP